MASANDTLSVLTIPVAMQAVTERVTYRVEQLFLPASFQNVNSIHTAAPGTGVEYISGCGCCPLGCLLFPCTQCSNGYGPLVFDFTWIDAGNTYVFHPIYWSNGVLLTPAFNLPTRLAATGDCVWEGTNRAVEFAGHPPTGIYIKVYYSSGWKVLFDYFTPVSGDYSLAVYVPSGNGVTYSLDTAVDCSKIGQSINITKIDGPPAPLFLVDQWQGFDAGFLSPALPTSIQLASCGNSTVLVDCCTERIPRRMTISFTGCPAIANDLVLLDNLGSNLWASLVDWIHTDLIFYYFKLSCEKYPTGSDPFTWVMRIYDYDPGTGVVGALVFTAAASSTTCYPIHLTFASGAFHFVHGNTGDYCNGTPFTIVVTV